MSRRSGFTLAKILVVAVIIGLLLAILIPVLGSAARAAKKGICMSNMHEIYQALTAYYDDFKYYPQPNSPMGTLVTAGKLSAIKTCPLDARPNYDSYSDLYNYWGYLAPSGVPQPLTLVASQFNMTVQGLAAQVYGQTQSGNPLPTAGIQSLVQNQGEWNAQTQYSFRDCVSVTSNEQAQYYLNYYYTGQYPNFVFMNQTPHGIQPGTPAATNYWKLLSTRWWNLKTGNPDTDFPGLGQCQLPRFDHRHGLPAPPGEQGQIRDPAQMRVDRLSYPWR